MRINDSYACFTAPLRASVRVTVACGITEVNPGEAYEAAFDRADAARYRAKSGGKNLCVTA